jgi:phosphoglucomutase/phosphomannomutase
VDAALENLARWRSEPAFVAYRGAIDALIAAERWDVLADSFRQVVPFGTGGRRGGVGVGPNRINPWTIGTSVEGHVRWLTRRFPAQPLSVVIAWDTRGFQDLAGVFPLQLDSPVRGLTSRDLGELAARIYARHGITSYLLPRGSAARVSTPELSWSIRALGASGGLNLSASHNPPDDNGIKVYDQRGAQLVPPDDEDLLHEVAAVADAEPLSWEEAIARGTVRDLDPAVHASYVAGVASLATPGERAIHVVYSPLHGTGCVDEVLAAAGFAVERLALQSSPDGGFSTVDGRLPNPERPEALAPAIARATELGATLVLATDPDADRIGCAVRTPDGWQPLTGNEIAALVVDEALSKTHLRRPLVVKTEVTSTLVARVAAAGGAAVVGDLLVGFKFVADGLRALEEEGQWAGFSASEVEFAVGCEESHGVLVTARMRDKDASGGGLFLAEAADREARRGRTLLDRLADLAAAHGFVRNTQLNLAFPGAAGQTDMLRLVDRWAASPPATLGGRSVVRSVDHRDPTGRFGPIKSESDRAARTVVALDLAPLPGDDGARVILRPSGTEPKLKVYLEQIGTPGQPDQPDRWHALVSDVRSQNS